MSTQQLKAVAKGESGAETTPAQRMQAFKAQLDNLKGELKGILGPRVSAEQFVGAAWAAVMHNGDLMTADRVSFFVALRQCANDGLVPDGREAVLNIYNTKVSKKGEPDRWAKKVQYLPMVGGLVKKLYEGGEVTYVDAAVVYERDTFAFRRGDSPAIEHEPYLGSEDPGSIRAAYLIAKLRNGEVKREVLPMRDILKIKAASKSQTGPWAAWEDQMAIKSVIKRAYKQLPRNPAMDRMVALDDALTINEGITEAPAQQAGAAPSLQFDPTATMGDLMGGSTVPTQREEQEPIAKDRPAEPRKQAATPTDDAPAAITFAEVADKLQRAQNADALDLAASLIGEVADAVQREELVAMFTSMKGKF